MKKSEKDEFDKTYGIFKFKRSLPKELEQAMGLTGEPVLFKKLIAGDWQRFYDIIKEPEPGDWLMSHKEYGQTYDEYKRNDYFPTGKNNDVIYIAPLSFSSSELMNQDFLINIINLCSAFFSGMKVRLKEISSEFNNVGNKTEDGQLQINAVDLLDKLIEEKPKDAFCLFALIDTDLYSENIMDDGKVISTPICGARNIPGRTSLFSFARFDPFFNKPKDDLNEEMKLKLYLFMLRRVCNAITREICYMFGMKNCIFFSCCMNGTSKTEFDFKPFELCPICLRKLITNISAQGQDLNNFRIKNPLVVLERFIKLRDSLNDNFYGIFETEVNWLNARIEFLKTFI